jgi:serine/threonine-protein kinase
MPVTRGSLSQQTGSDANLGRLFGHYQVRRAIGEGGMGIVYLAVQPNIGKRVAIKVLRPEFAANPAMVRRFFQEARLVNEIGDEHIVDIIDLGKDERGVYYLVMELLEGESLAARLKCGPLDESSARRIGIQTAKTLAAVHAIEVIHRDLKPDNIFILARATEPHFVKLLDFGIAKLTSNRGGNLTTDRVLMGTPLYISPEQVTGGTVGPSSDLYALGCILYQMVAGRPPFVEGSVAALLDAHARREPPPLRRHAPQVSVEYERIAMKCLAKAPAARFGSAAEVASALARPEPPTPAAAGRAPVRRRRAVWIGAVSLVALALGGLAIRWRQVAKATAADPQIRTSPAATAPAIPAVPARTASVVASGEPASAEPAMKAGGSHGEHHPARKPLTREQARALKSLQHMCEEGTVEPADCRAKRAEILRRSQ